MGKIREKFLKKKLLIVGGALGLGLFAFWIYTKANQTPVVTTVAAVRQDISQTLNTSGTVVSDKVVNCFACEFLTKLTLVPENGLFSRKTHNLHRTKRVLINSQIQELKFLNFSYLQGFLSSRVN